MTVLGCGAACMFGNAMIRVLTEKLDGRRFGTISSEGARRLFMREIAAYLVSNVDVEQPDSVDSSYDPGG